MTERKSNFFNIESGMPTIAVTVGGAVIAASAAAYHGIMIVAGDTTAATVTIYDNASAASGNVLDKIIVRQKDARLYERVAPILAKNGIYISATGTGMSGTLFYCPKG